MVSGIVNSFSDDILSKLGVESIGVGTTVSTSSDAGDLDFVIESQNSQEVYNLLSSIPELQEDLPQAPGIDRLFKLPGGAGVAVLYYAPTIDELVQVDVMPSSMASLDDVSWMLAGADMGGVKSRYRNILLSFIARELGARESLESGSEVKYTYAKGLQKKIDGALQGDRITDPDLFLPLLKINLSKQDVRSFEQLVEYMRSDQWMSTILPGFKEYINNRQHLQSKDLSRRSEAEMAAKYIEEDSVENSIREAISKILSEDRQEPLFTPAHLPPGESISIPWLQKNSIEDPLYDRSSHTLKSEGLSALVDGFINSNARVEGEMLEDGMTAYAQAIGAGSAEVLRGEGEDLKVGNRTYELKKSKINTPNLMLNASFPKSRDNHYYMFLTNMPTVKDVRNASGQPAAEDVEGTEDTEDVLDQEQDSSQVSLIDMINEILDSESTSAANALFDRVRVYIVPSVTLRLYILQSAFPGGGEKGPDQMYDPRTGEFSASGAQAMIENIKDRLDKIGIEYKIAEKLAPSVTKQIRDGLPPGAVEDGFDIKIGLLKVRIRLGIEPRSTVKE
jgi:hypothetical protein